MKGAPQLDHLRISDLRGLAQLMTQATAGVTRIAEGVHQSVWSTLGVPGGKTPGRTRGLTGMVYGGVHDGALLVGKGLDQVLAWLEPRLDSVAETEPETLQREAFLAALNGVMGDRLVQSGNPFALPMTLRYRGKPLDWQARPSIPEATGKVLVLIHGLCMNDLERHAEHRKQEIDHGQALAAALGYTPVYLRYNSGLHIAQNGRALAAQLEDMVTHWPTPIEELTVVAHSMGGLLTRSAFQAAQQESLSWPRVLRNIVFLGTPHHGAPLERAGHWVDMILGSTPYTAPFAKLGQLRSAGITDLRYGQFLDEERPDGDRFQRRPDHRQKTPLPDGVTCYTVAATKAAQRSILADRLLGDGLVPLHSALGLHDDPQRCLVFPQESQWITYRTSHMELLSSPEVTQQILRWLS